MKIVFMGTPEIAATLLGSLMASRHQLLAVVTQEDKPQGRHAHLVAPEVKQLAQRLMPELPLFQPTKARDPLFIEAIENLQADIGIVAAYGQILPERLLQAPKWGCLNIHYSLLPKLRGAAPIQRAILEGHDRTGITIQRMALKLDSGAILAQQEVLLNRAITTGQLKEWLTALSAPLLLELLDRFEKDPQMAGRVQCEEEVTFAPKIESEHARVDWNQPAHFIQQQIRAMDPDPGAWCMVYLKGQKKRVKLFEPILEEENGTWGKPAQLIGFGKKLLIATGKGSLSIGKIQPEGKSLMSAAAFCAGYSPDQIVIDNS